MARLLSPNNPQDLIILHAAFGRFFDGDMGNSAHSVIHDQKTPPASRLMRSPVSVRRSGLCRFIRVTAWDDQRCVIEDCSH